MYLDSTWTYYNKGFKRKRPKSWHNGSENSEHQKKDEIWQKIEEKYHFVWQLWGLKSQALKGLFGNFQCLKSAPGNTLEGEEGSESIEPLGAELWQF